MQDDHIKSVIQEGIREAFSVGEENKRFIDVNRVPLICQSIVQIGKDIAEMKDNMATKDRVALLEKVVYGGVAVILLAVLGAMVAVVLK